MDVKVLVEENSPANLLEFAITLSWSDLKYNVNTGKKNKALLNNLYGLIKPGSFLAVLGPSGAGKSTFLDVLAGRKTDGELGGEIRVNGQDSFDMRHISRYCVQQDALLGFLSVRQNLFYAAKLTLPQKFSDEKIAEIVSQALVDYGLEEVADTIIGSPIMKGCSGGQVRRCSVACQTVGIENGLLFLDEPTSGLDVVGAFSIIQKVKKLVDRLNLTAIATIHQPNSEIFELFTHVLILSRGEAVYFGSRDQAFNYFSNIGHPVPMNQNPADFYLRIINTDFGDTSIESVSRLVEAFQKSNEATALALQIHEGCSNIHGSGKVAKTFANGIIFQISVLTRRRFLNALKNPLVYWLRVILYCGLGAMIGSFWFRMGLSQSNVNDRIASLFFSVGFLGFMSIATIPSIIEEQLLSTQELKNGFYGVEAYLISQVLVAIPFLAIVATVFSIVTYHLSGLVAGAPKFFIYWSLIFILLLVAEAQILLIALSIPIFVIALTISAFANGIWMVGHGVGVTRYTDIPALWRYTFYHINFIKYCVEGLVLNEMKELIFNCATFGSGCACQIPSSLNVDCKFSGEEAVRYYYGPINLTTSFWALGIIFICFQLLTYLILENKYRKPNKKSWIFSCLCGILKIARGRS